MANGKAGLQCCFHARRLKRSTLDHVASRSRLETDKRNIALNARYAQKDQPISTRAMLAIFTRLTITAIQNTSTIAQALNRNNQRVTTSIQAGNCCRNSITDNKTVANSMIAGISMMMAKIRTATAFAP